MSISSTSLKVTVCVGSSCHVHGSRQVLSRFSEILAEQQVPYRVSLVGCLCMERCGETMNWKFDNQDISSSSADEAEQTLREKVESLSRRQE